MRLTLGARIFAGFLTMLAVFAGALWFAAGQIQTIREDLRIVHKGYLTLTRQSAQLRTLQEAKEEYVHRARMESDPGVRRHLVSYAREFYPRALRDRLAEMKVVSTSVSEVATRQSDRRGLADAGHRIARVQALHDENDEATVRLLESLESSAVNRDPENALVLVVGDTGAEEARAAVEQTTLVEEYQRSSEALGQEVRALAIALEGYTADALLGAERDVRQATLATFALALIALGVGLALLWRMNRALRPLRLLLDSARAIGKGSLDVEVPTAGSDEVGALAREFNEMARALRDRERTLAARNEELLRLKQFSDDVIRSIRVGIVIVDSQGCIRGCNPAARSVLHLPLIDLEGRALQDLPDLAEALAAVVGALATVQTSGTVRTFPLQKLGERIVDIALVPIRDRAGASLPEVLLLGEDVTTRERTRERLVQSERLAAIGRLAAQITHEIRNPLSSIGLNIDLLGDDIPHLPLERRDEARSILEAVRGEVERLAGITEGYLRYARLPAPQRVAGDVGDLLADLCAFSQGEAERAGVMWELRVDELLPSVPHDPQRLRQALWNLLRNAAEAAGRGGTVCLRALRRPLGDGVELIVEDSGAGIPEEIRERLFEPFFTTKADGTGLGLTLTREIVHEHGGELWVEDSMLGGAAFHVRLPEAGPAGPALAQSEASFGETSVLDEGEDDT